MARLADNMLLSVVCDFKKKVFVSVLRDFFCVNGLSILTHRSRISVLSVNISGPGFEG